MSAPREYSRSYVLSLEQDRDSNTGLLEELEQVRRQRDQFEKELCQVTAQVERLQDDVGRLEEALGTAEAFLTDLLEMDDYDAVGTLRARARVVLATMDKEAPR